MGLPGVVVADRRGRVVLLIRSRDWWWLPSSGSVSGFGPAVVGVCSRCGGRGEVSDRFGRLVGCVACGGRGRVAHDPMDVLGLPVASVSTVAPAARVVVVCDACDGSGVRFGDRCAYCGGEGRRPRHVFELRVDVRPVEERDPLAGMVDRRDRLGSYRELVRALDALRSRDRRVHGRLLEAVDARGLLTGELEEGLRFVVARMPDPVRVPREVVEHEREVRRRRTRARGRGSGPALAVRNREIRRLVRRGSPVQWVAQEYGLGVSTVYAIVREEEPST